MFKIVGELGEILFLILWLKRWMMWCDFFMHFRRTCHGQPENMMRNCFIDRQKCFALYQTVCMGHPSPKIHRPARRVADFHRMWAS